MKLMIASDIHGSALWCARLLDCWRREGAPRLLLLGDLLYHGPRNPLPEGYDVPKTAELLSAVAPAPLCVRGNCDGEVDQCLLRFPLLCDTAAVLIGARTLLLTHGHHREACLPLLAPGDLLLYGHTHVPAFETRDGVLLANPGSVSIPKEGSPHSCLLLREDTLSWLDLSGGGAYKTQRL